MLKAIFIAVLSVSVVSVRAGEELKARVTNVIDGNTIEVLAEDNEVYKVMFFGIDCPELGQEFGEEAKVFTEKLLADKSVELEWAGKDRWGNRLAIVRLEGVDLRVELLRNGYAWTAERNPIADLESHREQARANGKGLWKNTEPVAPWIYRRQQTMMTPKTS